jgi:hypothetical protein
MNFRHACPRQEPFVILQDEGHDPAGRDFRKGGLIMP